MKKIAIDSFEPGTYYDSPIFLDEKFLLITPDVPVSSQLIENLKAWGYKHVFTDGSPVGSGKPVNTEEGLAAVAVLDKDEKEKEGRETARTFYLEMTSFVE